MRKSKIYYLLGLILLFTVVLVGCKNNEVNDNEIDTSHNGNYVENNQDIVVNDNSQKRDEENEQEKIEKELENAEKNYYFYNGIFAGSYDGGNWYSPLAGNKNLKTRLWKYKEILDQDLYYAYSSDGEKKTFDYLEGAVGEGDGKFLPSEFEKYGRGSGDEKYLVFDLPTNLQTDLADMRSNLQNCYINMETDSEIIFTNADFDLKFAVREENIGLPSNVRDFVKNYIVTNGLSGDLDFSCASKHSCDIDRDGESDTIYNVEAVYNSGSPSKKMQELDEKGHFMMLILESENECSSILFEKVVPGMEDAAGYMQRVNQVDVIDLENDGFYEICLLREAWESQTMEIYDYVNGKYQLVAINNFGV